MAGQRGCRAGFVIEKKDDRVDDGDALGKIT